MTSGEGRSKKRSRQDIPILIIIKIIIDCFVRDNRKKNTSFKRKRIKKNENNKRHVNNKFFRDEERHRREGAGRRVKRLTSTKVGTAAFALYCACATHSTSPRPRLLCISCKCVLIFFSIQVGLDSGHSTTRRVTRILDLHPPLVNPQRGRKPDPDHPRPDRHRPPFSRSPDKARTSNHVSKAQEVVVFCILRL